MTNIQQCDNDSDGDNNVTTDNHGTRQWEKNVDIDVEMIRDVVQQP